MPHEVVQCKLGISRIILGATRDKGFPVPGQALRIEGKEDQEVIFFQCRDDRSFTELECHSDGSAEAPIQCLCPELDGFRRVSNALEHALFTASLLQADVVLGAGPVDADVGRERRSGFLVHESSPRCTIGRRGMHA